MTKLYILYRLRLAKEGLTVTSVNMLEAKTSLSKLVKALETHEEDVVYIARDGKPLVMMTLIPMRESSNRFGIAEGVFRVPDEFKDWDHEIEEMFEDRI